MIFKTHTNTHINILIAIISISFLFATTAQSNTQPTPFFVGEFTSPNGDYSVIWNTSLALRTVTYTVSAETTGWVGLGWTNGPNEHVNADTYVGWVDSDGESYLIDGFSLQQGFPMQDASQDAELIDAFEEGGRTTVVFRRSFDTRDGGTDLVIEDRMVLFMWSHGAEDGRGGQVYQYHDMNRGSAMVNWQSDEVPLLVEESATASFVYTVTIVVFVSIYGIIHNLYKLFKFLNLKYFGSSKALLRQSEDNEGYASFEDEVEMKNKPEHKQLGIKNKHEKLLKEGVVADSTSIVKDHYVAPKLLLGGLTSHGDATSSIADQQKELDNVWLGSVEEKPSIEFFISEADEQNGTVFKHEYASNYTKLKSDKYAFQNIFHSFLKKRIPYTQVSVVDSLFVLAISFFNCGFLFIWPDPTWNFNETLGFLTIANGFLVAVPATKNSLLVWFVGLPFDRTVFYHRWIGRFTVVCATFHFIRFYFIGGLFRWEGLAAYISLALVFLTSIEFIRRRFYHLFFKAHFLFLGFYIFGCIHAPAFMPYAIAAAAVYGADSLFRTLLGLYARPVSKFELRPGNLLKVRWAKKRGYLGVLESRYALGQYVFVNFPQVSLFEWHPFTLASGPNEPEDEINIRALGRHTQKVINFAIGSDKVIYIRVDGPYGLWPFNYSRYKRLILVAGGIGVTPCISVIRHIYNHNNSRGHREPNLQKVHFIWITPNEDTFTWFKDPLEEAWHRSKKASYPTLDSKIFITRANQVSRNEFIMGRPNLDQLFDGITNDLGNDIKRVAVVACGPRVLVNNIWDQCTTRSKSDVRWDFHHETFEF